MILLGSELSRKSCAVKTSFVTILLIFSRKTQDELLTSMDVKCQFCFVRHKKLRRARFDSMRKKDSIFSISFKICWMQKFSILFRTFFSLAWRRRTMKLFLLKLENVMTPKSGPVPTWRPDFSPNDAFLKNLVLYFIVFYSMVLYSRV